MNYETFALDLAKQARARVLANAKAPTHVAEPDAALRRGDVLTMCGAYVDARDIDCEHPTCEGCQQAYRRYDEMEF